MAEGTTSTHPRPELGRCGLVPTQGYLSESNCLYMERHTDEEPVTLPKLQEGRQSQELWEVSELTQLRGLRAEAQTQCTSQRALL